MNSVVHTSLRGLAGQCVFVNLQHRFLVLLEKLRPANPDNVVNFCCHQNYFLRAGKMYSFLTLLAVAQRIKDKDYNGYVQAEELLIGIYTFKYV